MPTVTEDYDSPKYSRDERGAVITRAFTVLGRNDPVLAAAEAGVPQAGEFYEGTDLQVTTVNSEPIHADETDERGSACRVTVVYKSPERQEKNKEEEDESEETFEVGVQQEHIAKALAAKHYPETADAVGLAINASAVKGDPKVEGVDIHAGVTSFTVTAVRKTVDEYYKLVLASLVATVNNDSFRGFSAGEVLFAGASGRRRGKGPWIITYHFLVSLNTEIKVELATGKEDVAKQGWQYFWVDHLLTVTDQEDEIKWLNRSAHVDDVYHTTDFGLLEVPA